MHISRPSNSGVTQLRGQDGPEKDCIIFECSLITPARRHPMKCDRCPFLLSLLKCFQNDIDVSLIINFQCILLIFTVMHLKSSKRCIIILNDYGIYGNLISKCPNIISGGKGHISYFIGSLLARLIRLKLISVQLDHPVFVLF